MQQWRARHKQGQAFVRGVVPGAIEGLTGASPLYGPVFRYIAYLAQLRRQLSPYLLYGDYRRPPSIRWESAIAEGNCSQDSAASMSASLVVGPPPLAIPLPTDAIDVQHVQQASAISWNRPVIDVSAWRSPGHRGAIVVASLDVGRQHTAVVQVSAASLGLPPGPVQVHLVTLGGNECLGTLPGDGWVRVTLPSCGALALEVLPEGEACP